MAKRKKIDRIDMRRLRREAEDHEREFESGITSRREALDCLRDLAATWKWMKTSFDTQAEAHAHFWARVHRSFDLLRFPDTDRVRILSQTEGLPEALWRAQYRPKPIATLDEVEAIESASEVMRRMKRSGFKRRDTAVASRPGRRTYPLAGSFVSPQARTDCSATPITNSGWWACGIATAAGSGTMPLTTGVCPLPWSTSILKSLASAHWTWRMR
jgi:hypothetical protein